MEYQEIQKWEIIIQPSKKSIKSICDKIRETIYKSIAIKSEELIRILNPIRTGWSNYHRRMCSKEAFKQIDKTVFESLWKWARKRHNSKSMECIKEKYWYQEKQGDWIFGTPDLRLKFASDPKIIRHRLIKFEANPYLPEWEEYYIDKELKQRYDKLKAELEI